MITSQINSGKKNVDVLLTAAKYLTKSVTAPFILFILVHRLHISRRGTLAQVNPYLSLCGNPYPFKINAYLQLSDLI